MATNCATRSCPRCGIVRYVNTGRTGALCRDCRNVKEVPAVWMEHAACKDPVYDPEWWWPVANNDPDTVRAVLVCQSCKVRDLCLDFAIQHDERHGVWGGRLPEERRRIRAIRRRAV